MNNLKALTLWFENLEIKNLDKIDLFYDQNVFFKDPFNEKNGIESVRRIFLHMFKTLENPRFIFIDIIENNQSSFLTWDFIFKIKGKDYKIHGSSHLKFNEEQKIIYHRDYWDVGEEVLLKIPLLKSVYGILQKKLATP
jgi:steroid delta-isomerase